MQTKRNRPSPTWAMIQTSPRLSTSDRYAMARTLFAILTLPEAR